MINIDLRSDTLTRPSPEMIQTMAQADVGDDAYGEDKHVHELEEYCASYFGKQAALFITSGTMSNQVALHALIRHGDEIICDSSYHINFFESAQVAELAKGALNPVKTADGLLTVDAIQEGINSKARWNSSYAAVSLIWLENSVSLHGGRIFPLDVLKEVRAWCNKAEIPIFMDGARLLNASIASGVHPAEYAACTDALTVCFSKGLRAPYGSILMGSTEFIAEAKKIRKWYGGTLHQSGYMAAAALYALKHNIDQLAEDNRNAYLLGEILKEDERILVKKIETNIVHFDITKLGINASIFVEEAKQAGVLLFSWCPSEIRVVTSSNVTSEQVIEAGNRLLKLAKSTTCSAQTAYVAGSKYASST